MKIVHTSDIHLDSPLTSKLSHEKAMIRRRELLSSFGELVEESKRLGAEAMIIAGDLFDSERITKKGLDTALYTIEKNPEIYFFYLPGNHEGDALSASGRELPRNLLVFGKEWTYFKAGSTVLAGRSVIAEGMFEGLELNPSDKNIVVLHGEPTDRTTAPEGIGLTDASCRGIDYMALGHYHTTRRYQLDNRGVAVYSGAPVGRGFDECGERGFILFDSESPKNYRFITFGNRQVRIISVDITGIGDYPSLKEAVENALSGASYRDIVRLELVGGRAAELWIDEEDIERTFSDRVFYLEVKNSSRLLINKEDYRHDRSLKGEFIRLVSSKEGLDEATKEKIIATGLYALLGE